jgi:uncharacterized protein RhaS with RHS repeats
VSYDLQPRLAVGCSVGRYYDPATGQFLSVDPLVQQTLEAYVYAADDPVLEVDPSGLQAETAAPVQITIGCGRAIGTTKDGLLQLVINWNCDEHNVVWEVSLEPWIQPSIEGNWTETGMKWWKNGVYRGRGSGHSRPAMGNFHGTWIAGSTT